MIRIACALAVAGIAMALGGGIEADGQQAGQINFLTDKKKAFDEARKTGKPLWVLFR